jgi:hypothetical protein
MFMCARKNLYTILTLIITSIAVSCKKFVDIPAPIDPMASEVIFTNDITATGAVTGIYSEMMNSINSSTQFSSSGITLYAGMCADELKYFASTSRDEFINNQITEANHASITSLFWSRAYKYIYSANLCREGLDKSTGVTPSVKTKLKGECYFIRAFCYFHLVNLFGDVPLALVSDYTVTSILGRTPKATVYNQIIADLIEAKNALPELYENPAGPTGRIRPNKWTATALLARVYLYKKEWNKAETEANNVISSGMYSLPADLTTVFLKSSPEAIWQLLPVNTNVNTWEGSLLLSPASSTSAPNYYITDTLLNSFEPFDNRKTNWTAVRNYQGKAFNYPAKYKVRTGTTVTEYYMVFRLAEQFLIRAEARAQQNLLAGAILDIDTLRHRAGLPGTTATTQAEVVAAIEHERQIELFAEWGHRWYDLIRTDRATALLGTLKPTTWQATDIVWPIPVSQIRLNPKLEQNDGY